ncbi:transcriptional regulator with XRE-family HTH domain [Nocardiopsis mwathae]|uniref:Transcriptional regulator with XRE-family HTH domain n=1 Tax=Nocardiopsis mwathae TaxID=1472723 RepID=A0A7W9YJB1_9ACTN|nr:Scr1 family TA system antitoxin-like transcriptional regulator [Nocardiopsis mwathae]MBB6173202.1 transcriptional regulator with XRE-family HTH domain [Nocardiopsis mwathae]
MASPTVRRWQIAYELRNMRGDRTQKEVAKALGVAQSSITRWEDPRGMLPRARDLRLLLEYYKISPERIEEMLGLRRDAEQRGWWQTYRLDKQYETFIGLEADSTRIQSFQSQIITGLLQTEGYARAVLRATRPEATQEEIERLLQVRMMRQERWSTNNTVKLWAILGEAALRQVVGGRTIMYEQLEHLREASFHPRVTLQVLPFDSAAHPALETTSFQVFQLSGLPLSAVFIDSRTGSLYLEDSAEIEDYEDLFNKLRAAAQDIDPTRQFLSSIAQEHRERAAQ